MAFAALKELASILDVADETHIKAGEPTYDQSTVNHICGTPACAIGHWIHAHPEDFHISTNEELQRFEITTEQWDELFGGHGCGDARSSKDAAKYIRDFIAKHS